MSFLASISVEDLRLLRKVVLNVHMAHYPSNFLSDYEADRVIEAFGEETCQNLIKTAVDSGAGHEL